MSQHKRCLIALFITSVVAASGVVSGDDFAIRDGDVVAFLGDSITAARTYGKLIENYTLLRYPERHVQFINVGKGGDTAAGGLERLERDVLDRGVTLLTVAYGVNDIGWGFRADDEHKQRYLDSIREIVRRCRERSIRVFICSAAVTGGDPDKTEKEFLQTMCDEGMKLSRDNGGDSIDVQRSMREIQRRVIKSNESVQDASKKESLHTADGVHLNELGQTAMAFAILKGLGAPVEVSSAAIDARQKSVLESKGCSITDISATSDCLEFTRLDKGLPLNAQTFFALHFRFIPIHDQLNRYMLQVKSLNEGDYELKVDDRIVGKYSNIQLNQGVNISSATVDGWVPGGPWDVQANVLHALTESRDQLNHSGVLVNAYLPKQSVAQEYTAEVQKANSHLVEMQRQIAKPRPYRFTVQKTAQK